MSNADFLLNQIRLSGSCDYQRMYNFNNYPTGGGTYNNGVFDNGGMYYNNNGGIFSNTDVNYTQNADGSCSYNYNQGPDKLMLGLGAASNIFSSIGSVLIAKDQAEVQQQQQIAQYQAYQQQAAQMAQQQQKQQAAESMQSMFQMMMMMKQFDSLKKE